jgi:heme exporter protein C
MRRKASADHVALASAELAVLFGAIVLVTGPLWARKAWGVWWQWGDVRLMTTFIMWMVFVSYLMLRRFGGPGSEMLASVVSVFGMALVPFVYWSVNVWRTIHPKTTVMGSLPPEMRAPFVWCIVAFLLLYLSLLFARVRLARLSAELDAAVVAMEEA